MSECSQATITDGAFAQRYLAGIHTLIMSGCTQETITVGRTAAATNPAHGVQRVVERRRPRPSRWGSPLIPALSC